MVELNVTFDVINVDVGYKIMYTGCSETVLFSIQLLKFVIYSHIDMFLSIR